MPKPIQGTYPAYFENYVSQVPETELSDAFKNQSAIVNSFFDGIDEEKSKYAYAPGKWTIKELMQHMIDAERIFNYRSLCFARNEQASLPNFEEKDYAVNSNANNRSWKELCNELKAVRTATELLFKSFNEEMLNRSGLANNKPATVNALGFITVGHLYHHKKIIESRYLSKYN